MTATAFQQWLADMKSAGLARSGAECGRLLGVTADTVVNYKKRGAPLAIALACAAVLSGLPPYA